MFHRQLHSLYAHRSKMTQVILIYHTSIAAMAKYARVEAQEVKVDWFY